MKIQPTGLDTSGLQTPPTRPEAPVQLSSDRIAPTQEQSKTTVLKPEELKEATRQAVEKISNFVNFNASDLQFTVDQETDTPVVKVIDRTTKEVIRQIPSQEAIEISKALDKLQGLLIKNQA